MNTQPQRFERAVAALVQAYFDETFESTNCKACAVGNIVAAGYGVRVKRDPSLVAKGRFVFSCEVENDAWSSHFVAGEREDPAGETAVRLAKGYENIAVTGYSMEELMLVESTLLDVEWNAIRTGNPDPVYTALLAVIDVLCQIEGIPDADPTKALFVKPSAVALIPNL